MPFPSTTRSFSTEDAVLLHADRPGLSNDASLRFWIFLGRLGCLSSSPASYTARSLVVPGPGPTLLPSSTRSSRCLGSAPRPSVGRLWRWLIHCSASSTRNITSCPPSPLLSYEDPTPPRSCPPIPSLSRRTSVHSYHSVGASPRLIAGSVRRLSKVLGAQPWRRSYSCLDITAPPVTLSARPLSLWRESTRPGLASLSTRSYIAISNFVPAQSRLSALSSLIASHGTTGFPFRTYPHRGVQ
nr:hypothetical protein CFP56_20397 [Quercus suber]